MFAFVKTIRVGLIKLPTVFISGLNCLGVEGGTSMVNAKIRLH